MRGDHTNRRLWPRINGRRGTYLLFKGLLFIFIGLAYLVPTPSPGTERSLSFLLEFRIPFWAIGVGWFLAGLVGIVGAFFRKDGWAFGMLAAVASGWTLIYLISWATGGSPRGYFLALPFAAIAGATIIVSGMVSAGEVLRQRPDGGG
ncbi:hypothetical protein [Pseudactinotalea suaedae]|uniref:hypothetical protein n=1 Tax=Pseudactinotalea suaedae TaxID=1524924 RepID=UPI0012E0FEC8|nr:hypothetical protein [Pseudactinotalea suaedae]